MSNRLGIDDFVFAKLRGYRAWPARIMQFKGNIFTVYFYGTRNIANLSKSRIFDYVEHRLRMGKCNPSYRMFRDAMRHVEYAFKHPDDDEGFFQAKSVYVLPNQRHDDSHESDDEDDHEHEHDEDNGDRNYIEEKGDDDEGDGDDEVKLTCSPDSSQAIYVHLTADDD